MRFYAIVLIAWAAIVASLESNVTKFNDEKAVSYTEFRDLSAKQSHSENVEARNPEKMGVENHSDRNVNVELSSSDVSADKRESSDTFTSSSSLPVSIYSTPFTKTIANYSFRKHLNYEPKYTVPEDISNNAGSFGQRIWHGHPGDKAIVKSTTETTNSRSSEKHTNFQKFFNSSVSLENEDDGKELYVSITHEPFVYAQRKENISDNLSSDSPEVIEDPNGKNFDENFDVGSITEHSSLGKTNVASFFKNASENLLTSQAGSSGTYHDVADKIARKSTEFVKKSESVNRTSTSVEINPLLQIRKFTSPIVVPDLPDREDSPQDVVDYLDYDNDASGAFKSVENAEFITKVDAEPSKAASNSITTSSIMLNPLQVGITLMNADETGTLTDNSEQSAMDTKNYVQNNLERSATVNEEFVNRNESRVDCRNENFPCDEKDKSVVAQKVPDNSVEIQKSIELYYAAPVHEIHYPAEYIRSSNLDIKTNALQRSKQQYDQGNYQVDRNIKAHAFGLQHKEHNRHEYNALEDDAGKPMASALIAESSVHEQRPHEALESQPFKYNNVQPIKPYTPTSTYREQLHLNNPYRSFEVKRPETSQLLLKIIPEGSSANGGFLVPIRQPHPIVEKTVHAPHPIEIKKVIEKKVPIPVQVPVSQPYPVRVQVPVDIAEKQIHGPHLYPIYIEKRIPYMVKRLQSTAYPQHMKLSAAYSIEKSPSHAPIEKVTEKPVAFSPPSRLSYRANTDRPISDNNGAIETKFNKYQHKLRESVFVGDNANSADHNNAVAGGFTYEPHQSETNTSQFYSDLYSGSYDHDNGYIPTGHFNAVKLMILPKKFNDHVVLRSHVIAPSYAAVPVSYKRQIMYNLVEKDKAAIKDAGLTSPRKTTQDKIAFPQIKFSPQFSASTTQITATLRRSRQPEAQYTGNFRQSKMEYGFKPPMIPSVQYDEKTGSKVEN